MKLNEKMSCENCDIHVVKLYEVKLIKKIMKVCRKCKRYYAENRKMPKVRVNHYYPHPKEVGGIWKKRASEPERNQR